MEVFSLLEQYTAANIGLSLEQERELLAKYIHSTNQLEGNTLTLAQTQSIIDNGEVSGDQIKTRDILEQKGTYKALVRMMKAVREQEPLSIDLIKELNWLTIGTIFQDDYYFSYKEQGQKYGDFKVKNNRIMITTSDGKEALIEPLSSPDNVAINMKMLLLQIENSDKNVIEKAAFLAQEIWLHQPFIDGNKRTARLLVNFLTMKKGSHSNQVWEIDITYIPMAKGFMYLTAIIDVYSRYIVGWGLSNSLDADSSLNVVKEAVQNHGQPMILNSDQGSQFTCSEYIEYLKGQQIQISMDGKGRALDNIYIERFWRTIKYQHIFLNPAKSGIDLFIGIKKWIEKYHYKAHQGIDRTKPINRYKLAA